MNSHKHIAITLIFVLLLCMFVWGDGVVRCLDKEREALLSFKAGVIDVRAILSSWQGEECCKWYGVACSNTTGHVIGLALDGALRGKIGSSLLDLSRLNYLDLSYNNFGGQPIPEFLGSMKQLKQLYLVNSNFAGMIPPQLGNLTNLTTLSLSYNYLTSQNLDWLSTLSLLSTLDLSLDLSDANLLQQIFNLPNLHALSLPFCNIGGLTLPFHNSTSLSVLDLSYNHLTSSMFQWLPNITATLNYLSLSNNALGGHIPNVFHRLRLLEYLDLSNNALEGVIPTSLGNLSYLQSLDVSRNFLEGTVSESHLVNLNRLKFLDLSSNSLTIHIGPDWIPPFVLDVIDLSGCKMGPAFPKWIQTQKNLSRLYLSSCGIVELPKWLWGFSPSLQVLFLSDNQINGTIPSLSSASIPYLDLSYNNISGPIPLLHPSSASIQLSHNIFSGSISSLCQIPHNTLFFLDLSNNMLSGEIPDCQEKMISIFYLNLASNTFSGHIPPFYRGQDIPRTLSILQLSGNNLTGELPATLRFSQTLSMLDVGGNKLSGNIPSWLGYTNITYLDIHGNTFSGSISPDICNLAGIQVLDFSGNNLSGEIPDCFNNFISLAETNTRSSYVGFRYNVDSNPFLPHFSFVEGYGEISTNRWKGYISLVKVVDFSSNRLSGNIPGSVSSMRGLNSLNLSRNSLQGNIIPDIGEMEKLESLDLSYNQFSGEIPTSLARLYNLTVLDLSNNNLTGKIPSGTQLQGFNASAYAGNSGLCGPPLGLCENSSRPRPPTTNMGTNIATNIWFYVSILGTCWFIHTQQIMEK